MIETAMEEETHQSEADGGESDVHESSRDTRIRLTVRGMSCVGCAKSVEKAAAKVGGVHSAVVNVAAGAAAVRFDPTEADPQEIVEAIDAAGFRASIGDDEEQSSPARDQAWLLWTAALAAPIILAHQGQITLPGGAWAVVVLATILQFTSGLRFYRGAWYSLRAGGTNMDVLVALGITCAWGYSVAVSFAPALLGTTQTFFEASAMLILFIRLGKLLEARAKGKADDALRSLLRYKPDTARLVVDGVESETAIDQVKTGDLLRVRPGDRIPVDGEVIEGDSAVDESPVTGESVPIAKNPGDAVTGGTVAVDGSFVMRATAVGEESFLAGMIRMVEEAQLDKAPVQRFADRVSNVFVPIVIALAASTFIVWKFALGADVPFCLARAVAVVVVACPCALGLATPTAILVGTGVGLRRGILFKRGSALETVARVRAVLFDKTGTVTTGRPELSGVALGDERTEERMLSLAAAGAKHSNHPFSRAIAEAAEGNEVSPAPCEDFEEIPGRGIRYRVGGESYELGSREFVTAAATAGERFDAQAKHWEADGMTVLWLGHGDVAAGLFALRDEPRDGATEAVARIENLGVRTALVTGDRVEVAEGIAAHVGIGSVYAGVKPDEKAKLVEESRKELGVVAMVGDGLNDAPALSAADVGIALGAGTDVAKEAGDIIVVGSDPSDVASALELGRATLSKIRQNLFWAMIYNILAIPLAAGVLAGQGVLLPPAVAGLAMSLSSITVVLNSLDLKRWRPVGS